ncbi:MAG: flippase-like domain-containing protein [Proteobacteria bacterium]|nr:flippase-like domain-containing protein [Pseudomonadota bacterium]
MVGKIRSISLNILRFLIAFLLMYIILRRINFAPIIRHIRTINYFWLAVSFLLTLLLIYFNALRWKILLKTHSVNAGIWKLYRVYLIGFFFNNFLPSSIGLDTVRTVYMKEHGIKEVASSVLVERFIGVTALFLYSFIGAVIIGYMKMGMKLVLYASVLLVIMIIVFLMSFNKKFLMKFKPLVLKIKYKNIGKELISFYNLFFEFANNKKKMFWAFLISLLMQTTIITINIVIAKMYAIQMNYIFFFVYIPIISVLSMIPISINALGVREGAYVYFFGRIGISKEISLLFSLTYLVITALTSLIGGIMFPFEKSGRK